MRARGLASAWVCSRRLERFLHARAGTRRISHQASHPCTVSPCARGDSCHIRGRRVMARGFSMRARGLGIISFCRSRSPRFLHARAGTRPRSTGRLSSMKVSPCARGDSVRRESPRPREPGFSMRARGLASGQRRPGVRQWFLHARAGTRSCRHRMAGSAAVSPCARGDSGVEVGEDVLADGFSMRARGLVGLGPQPRYLPRFLHARAGTR